MVLGFGLIVTALLMLYSGFTGKTLGQAIKGELGTGFISFDSLPKIDIIPGAYGGAGGGTSPSTSPASFTGSTNGGARGIVEDGAKIGAGFGLKVISDYRPGDHTTTGSVSDHSGNDENRAARDISNAKDGITGPPTTEMDAAVEAIASAFGQRVNGKHRIVLTWNWHGYRLQLIYRTPEYGGHMGHIHFGARKL